jgi:hypothetical protein
MNNYPGLAQRLRRSAADRWAEVLGLPRPRPLTSGVKSRSAGLDLPREFPVGPYDDAHALVMDRLTASLSLQREFNGAWNAVVYRFLAAAELDTSLRRSFRKFGAAPPIPERYRQERDLFAFLANACSVLDSLAYALYALNAGPYPLAFPLVTRADRTDVGFFRTMDLYRIHFPHELITQQLVSVSASPDFEELRRLRTVLVHRSSPSHNVRQDGETDDSVAWDGPHPDNATEVDPALTARLRAWLAETLRDVVPAAVSFVRADPPLVQADAFELEVMDADSGARL